MTEKARRDWRSWGMYPGRKYYVVAVGRPEQVDEGTRYYVHSITKTDGKNAMCVFSTAKKAKRFIRGGLEGDPQAYLDLLEDRGGSLPAGLREGDYTLIEKTPDGLAEIGLEMGIHSMVLDPGPGENHPIPIGGGHPGLDPDGEYYVLLFRRALEADVCFHYVNHRGED